VRFGGAVARGLWWFDVRVVDGTVNGIAALTQSTGRGIRQIQTGHVQNYALGIAAGLLVIAVAYLFVITR
jgi:NADH-quinone oxidoreductase subunit L